MDLCSILCTLIMIGTVIFIIASIVEAVQNAKKKKEDERKEAEDKRQRQVDDLLDKYKMQVAYYDRPVQHLIMLTDYENYSDKMVKWLRKGSSEKQEIPEVSQIEYRSMEQDLDTARAAYKTAHDAKLAFDEGSLPDDRKAERDGLDLRLRQTDALLEQLPARIQKWKDAAERAGAVSQQWHRLSSYTLMSDSYGEPHEKVLQQARDLAEKGTATAMLSALKSLHDSSGLERWLDANPAELPILALAFAFGSPADPASVNDCQQLWQELVWKESCDIYLADLYARKSVGGVAAVRDAINTALRTPRTTRWYETVSSALMWMGAYDSEEVVLQHMLSLGLPMSDAVKERLKYLSSTSVSVAVLDVDDTDALSFDTTALGWGEDEYAALFDNLVYKNRTLTYSLAVREEDKSIAIPSGFAYPTRQQMLATVVQVADEEYGSEVEVTDGTCVALANGVEERMDGFVARTANHPEMALVTISERIGHRLNIKFYTLFCPSGVNEADRAAASSINMNLNPKVGMWEMALKDTMLAGIQKALNTPASVEDDTPDYF